MDCAAEESEIRAALAGVAGIRSLGFHLSARTLTIDADRAALAPALAAIRAAGFDPQPLPDTGAPDAAAGKRRELQRLAFALACAAGAELLAWLGGEALAWRITGSALAALAIALAGFGVYRKGLAALRDRRLNINALMTVAVTGAFLIGQWAEAAMVMALYAIAEAIEARAVDRARNAIGSLLKLAPDRAELRQPDGSWRVVPAAEVAVAAIVRVRPGQRVPLDGTLVAGSTSVDQASVTGESLPVDKAPGDALFAGTINLAATIELRVTAPASQSTLARIIHAVEQAQGSRAPTQRFVDRFAAVYTPAVFALALAVAIAGPWIAGWAALDAIYKALVLLVIACPCALVISTPVAIVSGLAAGARRGILIKGGVYLEQARRLKAIAFDKTGTITEGAPRLATWTALDASADAARLARVAAALAGHSQHPVSKAIAEGLPASDAGLEGFQALAGRGVEATVDGERYLLGNHRLIEERGLCSPGIEALLREHEAQGRTTSLLATENRALALFAVADTVKPEAAQAIAELDAMGFASVMLSGDNQRTAEAVAREAGLRDARGSLLPEDKLAAIDALRERHATVAMAGDGINDAPALARADIGIAMGAAGTDAAMEAADVVVMNDDLRRIPELIRLSRATHAILVQNIALALAIKALFLGLAIFDDATMWMAVFADVGASLIVIGNSLRLRAGGRAR
ncbi:MAG TPA: heavy metal translocating P-type ATPase [Burkholderiaceae bacterium]|nr:heavy metal translocating P-type ATPase [Burkholderiaceae bacterium]